MERHGISCLINWWQSNAIFFSRGGWNSCRNIYWSEKCDTSRWWTVFFSPLLSFDTKVLSKFFKSAIKRLDEVTRRGRVSRKLESSFSQTRSRENRYIWTAYIIFKEEKKKKKRGRGKIMFSLFADTRTVILNEIFSWFWEEEKMLRFANYSLFLKYENCDSVKNLSFEFNLLLLLCCIKFGYIFIT